MSEQDKTYTTIVPYKVVRAGEYILNSKTKIVNGMSLIISGHENSVCMAVDGEYALVFDRGPFIRELLKCPELVAEIMNIEAVLT